MNRKEEKKRKKGGDLNLRKIINSCSNFAAARNSGLVNT